MDRLAEAPGQPLVANAEATGHESFEMTQGLPKQCFHHVAVAGLVGMGQRVARGRDGPAQAAKPASVDAQGVADIVEPDGMSELGIDQTDDMTPRSEGPGFLVDTHSRQLKRLIQVFARG